MTEGQWKEIVRGLRVTEERALAGSAGSADMVVVTRAVIALAEDSMSRFVTSDDAPENTKAPTKRTTKKTRGR